jgi:hypothetical protein
MVADNPQEKIELKAFCAEIINDHKALGNEQASYRELPQFSKVETTDVVGNYFKVKNDVAIIVQIEMKE